MIVKKIRDKIYGRKIIFVYGGNSVKINKFLREEFGKGVTQFDKDEDAGFCEAFKRKRKIFVLWLQTINKNNPKHIGILAHEILHLTILIVGYVGFKIDSDSDEPLCYYHQYLFEQIYKLI